MRVFFLVPLLVSVSLAADRPVAGDRLTLKDPAGRPESRSVRFKAARDFAVDPLSGVDPRSVGATLEVVGANPGDGNSGPVPLPPELWIGLGKPAGSKGYRFKDPLRTDGVKTVTLKTGSNGGTLSISGGKSNWTYAITQAQGPIDRAPGGGSRRLLRALHDVRQERARQGACEAGAGAGRLRRAAAHVVRQRRRR